MYSTGAYSFLELATPINNIEDITTIGQPLCTLRWIAVSASYLLSWPTLCSWSLDGVGGQVSILDVVADVGASL
jgi:hypothetical protein